MEQVIFLESLKSSNGPAISALHRCSQRFGRQQDGFSSGFKAADLKYRRSHRM